MALPTTKRMGSRPQGPLAYCPFTGRPVQLKHIPGMGAWVAVTKQYVFGPFATRGELLFAFSTRDGKEPNFTPHVANKAPVNSRPPSPLPAPLDAPTDKCPFTGKPVVIELGGSDPAGSWMIQGHKYLIGGFPTKRHAQHFLSTRLGVTPNFGTASIQSVKPRGEIEEEADEVLEGTGVKDLENMN